jgi:hypothetical protein
MVRDPFSAGLAVNRQLLIPLAMVDAIGAAALAFGLGAKFSPEQLPFRWLAAHDLAMPAIVLGAVLMALSLPLMIKLVLNSTKR